MREKQRYQEKMKRLKQKEQAKKKELMQKQQIAKDDNLSYSTFLIKLHQKEQVTEQKQFKFTYNDLLEDIKRSSEEESNGSVPRSQFRSRAS